MCISRIHVYSPGVAGAEALLMYTYPQEARHFLMRFTRGGLDINLSWCRGREEGLSGGYILRGGLETEAAIEQSGPHVPKPGTSTLYLATRGPYTTSVNLPD